MHVVHVWHAGTSCMLCMCGMLARRACTACKCDCILLPVLLPIEKSNRKLGRAASPGPRFAYKNRIHWVSGESYANPDVRRAAFLNFSRPGVCVSKPSSLDFRGVVRKPGRPPGRLSCFFPARGLRIKTEFIGFRGVVRKPGRPPGAARRIPIGATRITGGSP